MNMLRSMKVQNSDCVDVVLRYFILEFGPIVLRSAWMSGPTHTSGRPNLYSTLYAQLHFAFVYVRSHHLDLILCCLDCTWRVLACTLSLSTQTHTFWTLSHVASTAPGEFSLAPAPLLTRAHMASSCNR